MLQFNVPILFAAALIPLLVGFIWYHKALFGLAWIREAELSDEKSKRGPNMIVTFLVTYVLGILMAFMLQFVVIHQMHFYSILANEPGINDPNSPMGKMLSDFFAEHGDNFRTFKHGCLHGFIAAFTFAIPILCINALFERKSFKYMMINAGYWLITVTIMGGIISAFP